MTKAEQKKVLKEVKNFIKDYFGSEGEYAVRDMQFLTGDEGVQYCEYAHEKSAYVSFDGSPVYSCLNYGEDGWRFENALTEMLRSIGCWFEMGHSWNMNIIKD